MDLRPTVNSHLLIGGVNYTFSEHPAAKGMPYGQSGRRATVYQVRAPDNSLHAIKIFTESFRESRIAETAGKLLPYANMPGLQVCRRLVLTPQATGELIKQHENLRFSVLMPWVYGETWQEFILGAQPLDKEHSRLMAQSFAHILASMEAQDMAHGDLSGPNVLLPGMQPASRRAQASSGDTSLVALVDVEDIYAPGLPQPEKLPGGSAGYAHQTADIGIWAPYADRFSGGIILSEMLAWCNPDVIQIAYGEQYFDPAEVQQNSERYQILLNTLRTTWGPEYGALLGNAWNSQSMTDCPKLAEWSQLLGQPEAGALEIEQTQEPTQHRPEPTRPSDTPQEKLARSLIERAEVYMSVGQVDKALIELEEAYRTMPDVGGEAYARGLKEQAEARERMGSLPAALDDYRHAISVAPPGIMRTELQSAINDITSRMTAAGIKPGPPTATTTGFAPPVQASQHISPPPTPSAPQGGGFSQTFVPPTPQVSTPLCPNCHSPLESGAVRCVNCGFPLQRPDLLQTVAVEGVAQMNNQYPDQAPGGKRSMAPLAWVGIILGALILCGGVIVVGWLILGSAATSPSATATLPPAPTVMQSISTAIPTTRPLPTEEAANLPTPALTETPSPTATQANFSFSDDFSKSGAWVIVKDPEEADSDYAVGGTYYIHVHRANKMSYAVAPLPVQEPLKDMIVTTSFTTPLNPKGEVGILCRVANETNFYRVGIFASSGQYRFSKFINGNYTYLTKTRYAESYDITSQASNTISMSCIGESLSLSVNGTTVAEVRDADLPAGEAAVYAATYGDDTYNKNLGFKAVFDSITVEEPPAQ